jgi:coiled-coil domain-containing protein 12
MSEPEPEQPISFHSYVPRDARLRALVRRLGSVPSREVETLLNESKRQARVLSGDDKAVLVTAKRANWDLKRDVDKRLKKLTKRTQVAISYLAEELQPQEDE